MGCLPPVKRVIRISLAHPQYQNMTISIHVSRALCHLPLAMAPIDTGGYSAGDWNGRGSRCVRILRMKVLILLAEKGWFSMVFPPKVRLT